MNDVAAALREVGTAMVGEANGCRGAAGPDIKPLWQGARLAGPARTAFIEPGDNLGAHVAVERCRPGEVLCLASTPAAGAYGGWGEVLARFAITCGATGLITNIGVRDLREIADLGFPVFGTSCTIQGTGKKSRGQHDVPVVLGRVVIRPGDWVVGDCDGVAVVARDRVEAVIDRARQKVAGERRALAEIANGATTRDALGLP